MSQEQDFKKLQQRTYASNHQDGLIDIIIGLAIIGFGLMLALDSSVFSMISWMPIIFYVPFKNRITVPRIGYVKFYASNKIVLGLVITGLLVLLLGLVIFFISGPNIFSDEMLGWFRQYYMLLFGGIAAVCFFGAGLLTGITRLYVYALLFLLIFIVGTYLNLNPAVYVLIMGTLIEAVGIWLMVRFLRKYPLPEQEGAHE
jgi:hypothetical protein